MAIRVVNVTVKAKDGSQFKYDVVTKNILRKPQKILAPSLVRNRMIAAGLIKPVKEGDVSHQQTC